MATTANANITISFSSIVNDPDGGGSPETTLELEVNETDQADGDTNFIFGDTAFYRVYKGSRISGLNVIVSDGDEAAVSIGNIALIENEVVSFVNSNTANTQYPIDGNFTATLIGGTGAGTLSWTAGSAQVTGSKANSDTDPIVGVYLVSYQTRYDKRKLSGVSAPAGWPADVAYPVVVVVIGTVA